MAVELQHVKFAMLNFSEEINPVFRMCTPIPAEVDFPADHLLCTSCRWNLLQFCYRFAEICGQNHALHLSHETSWDLVRLLERASSEFCSRPADGVSEKSDSSRCGVRSPAGTMRIDARQYLFQDFSGPKHFNDLLPNCVPVRICLLLVFLKNSSGIQARARQKVSWKTYAFILCAEQQKSENIGEHSSKYLDQRKVSFTKSHENKEFHPGSRGIQWYNSRRFTHQEWAFPPSKWQDGRFWVPEHTSPGKKAFQVTSSVIQCRGKVTNSFT